VRRGRPRRWRARDKRGIVPLTTKNIAAEGRMTRVTVARCVHRQVWRTADDDTPRIGTTTRTSLVRCIFFDFGTTSGHGGRSRLRACRSGGIVAQHLMEAPAMKTVRIASVVSATLCACLMLASHSVPAGESEAEAEANRVAHDHVLCRKYQGLEEGTDEFAHCLDVLAKRRADAAAEAKTKHRQASSQARALSAAENNACDTRSQVVNGGGRGQANAHETGAGTCGH
jgi:hypothetical protein